ncbi:MAG: hypothetical protein Q8R31_01045 [Candidatus Omnitrophota bacterium]|nr:hypothetical protein [Candidatus Omnitrophota bacterium]
MGKQDIKNLKKRYLLWMYKTNKEALDRIERKFTQLEIDRFILQELRKSDRDKIVQRFITEFNNYIQNKEKEAVSLKYENKDFPAIAGPRHRREKPEYSFLVFKLMAIEKAISRELGKGALEKIKDSYTQEMFKRIIEEKANKT